MYISPYCQCPGNMHPLPSIWVCALYPLSYQLSINIIIFVQQHILTSRNLCFQLTVITYCTPTLVLFIDQSSSVISAQLSVVFQLLQLLLTFPQSPFRFFLSAYILSFCSLLFSSSPYILFSFLSSFVLYFLLYRYPVFFLFHHVVLIKTRGPFGPPPPCFACCSLGQLSKYPSEWLPCMVGLKGINEEQDLD